MKQFIFYETLDLRIEYPPIYERLVWNYKQADTIFIQRVVNEFNWKNAFYNIGIDKKVEIFNEIILNIFSNYCPSRTIVCNDKNPPWLTDRIKTLMEEKNAFYSFLVKK